jgi:hypothetical protein
MAETLTMVAEDAKRALRAAGQIQKTVDGITGEIKDRPRQASLSGMAAIERHRDYRVQVTVTTEATVSCHDEGAAAEIGVNDIEAGLGEIIKRQVSVTYLRPKD